MPHQFQSINCKKCGYHYCPVCKERCPKCDEVDIADAKTMGVREQMRRRMNRDKKIMDNMKGGEKNGEKN